MQNSFPRIGTRSTTQGMPNFSVAIYLGHIHVPVKLSLTLQVIELDQCNVTSVSYPWQL